MTNIEIPNSVISIGNNAFERTGLINLMIPNSVKKLGNFCFDKCTELKSLIIGTFVGVNSNSFADCTGLIKVACPDSKNWNFPSSPKAKVIKYPAEGAILENGAVYSSDSSTLYYVHATVSDSYKIENSVRAIGSEAFTYCADLKSIVIPESVSVIGNSAFEGCDNLEMVEVPNLNTWFNIDFGDELANPISLSHKLSVNNQILSELIIPDTITQIKDYTFYGLHNMEVIEIPESVMSIGACSFRDCIGTKKVVSKAFIPAELHLSSFEGIYDVPLEIPEGTLGMYLVSRYKYFNNIICGENAVVAFEDDLFKYLVDIKNKEAYIDGLSDNTLTSVTIPERMLYSGIEGEFFCKIIGICAYAFKNGRISNINLPNTLQTIGEYAFEACPITGISLPSSLERIGRGAFKSSKIMSITIPESILRIEGETFENCSELTEVSLPSNIKYIGKSAFRESNIRTFNFPDSLEYIDDYAFYKTRLESCNIPASVKFVGECAFASCSSLKSAKFEDGFTPITLKEDLFGHLMGLYIGRDLPEENPVTLAAANIEFGDCVRNILGAKFTGCHYLKLGNSIEAIEEGAFEDCRILDKIVFPGSLTSIGARAFKGSVLGSVVLPPNLNSIGESAFESAGLSSVAIGSKVTSIGDKAFIDNNDLSSVYITAKEAPMAQNTSFNTYKLLYVTPGCKDIYYNNPRCWYRFSTDEMTIANSLTVSGYNNGNVRPGEVLELKANLTPEGSSLPYVFWRSTDTEFATVSSDGVVTVHGGGSGCCKIIAETLYADCNVVEVSLSMNDNESDVPASVDLGLSVNWSEFNYGAYFPDDYGVLYGWGVPAGSGVYPNVVNIGGNEYDVLSQEWGHGYRIPTEVELNELNTKCIWTSASINGVNGFKVTGPNGNSIFIPAAGVKYSDGSIGSRGDCACLWSSWGDYGFSARALHINAANSRAFQSTYKCDGLSLRGVTRETVTSQNPGSGISDIMDDDESVVSVYNLNGLKVFEGMRSEMNLPAGIYIMRSNGKTYKIALR